MLQHFLELLATNQLLLLFTVIGLGFLVGSIRILGFSLGAAAVLFVGIFFGALDPRLALPEEIYIIGLVLFIYTIGLQSGPTFFSSFGKKGLRSNLFVIAVLLISAVATILIAKIASVAAPLAAGLFCGALTNTPALAATVEAVKAAAAGQAPGLREQLMNAPVVAYGLAYPFGVLGVLMWFFVFRVVFKVDFAKEEEQRKKEAGSDEIQAKTLHVLNPAVNGESVADILRLIPHPGFVFSRIRKGERVQIVTPETVFQMHDLVLAVGTTEALERARVLLGEFSSQELGADAEGFEYRRMFVSSPRTVGKQIHELNLEKEFGATITRLRRGDTDFVPDPHTVLELGDRVRVVAGLDNIPRVTNFFGDSMKSISETDYLSLSLGIVLGVFLGMMPIYLPGGSTFKLGFAGGPLLVSLILGRLQRTGSITWTMPFNANLVLRQVGLVFFLAGIGTRAGYGFGSTFADAGWLYIGAGALITTTASVLTIAFGYKLLKLPMSAVMGVMSGLSTQPACLAYANQQVPNDQPNIHYATVYPAAMITKIILAQLLVTLLW